ncbi:Putative hypothetical protein [Helicobacter mustelae 12198]|uniref:Uncharacterized protein n=1 Tax=Helicobacter mustelae (strain ATCC 43772 / CCUG 25715 / CIP 103759 / LMG 18044 / NCTC 12198 / R85-136P) TaxID=679897 RepID=D3UH62_HELM1|nr:Putative hypothetical protein [Helicobacter mustelae 12198]
MTLGLQHKATRPKQHPNGIATLSKHDCNQRILKALIIAKNPNQMRLPA